jgi:hypothetical protein
MDGGLVVIDDHDSPVRTGRLAFIRSLAGFSQGVIYGIYNELFLSHSLL